MTEMFERNVIRDLRHAFDFYKESFCLCSFMGAGYESGESPFFNVHLWALEYIASEVWLSSLKKRSIHDLSYCPCESIGNKSRQDFSDEESSCESCSDDEPDPIQPIVVPQHKVREKPKRSIIAKRTKPRKRSHGQ